MEKALDIKNPPKKEHPEFLYKFRPFDEHALDIILFERLYCSQYKNLNDPFEGMLVGIFNSIKRMRPGVSVSPSHMRPIKNRKFIEIDELPIDLTKTRICSLSKDCNDVRLWAHYADGNRGIAIQIKFPDSDTNIHKVSYPPTFSEFELKNANSLNSSEILTRKTEHWEYEREYRILYHEEFYPIKDRISSIFLGTRIEDKRKDMILKIVPKSIPVYSTRINDEKVHIEKDLKLN